MRKIAVLLGNGSAEPLDQSHYASIGNSIQVTLNRGGRSRWKHGRFDYARRRIESSDYGMTQYENCLLPIQLEAAYD